MEQKELWKKILLSLEPSIKKSHFITWFQNTAVISLEEGVLIIGVPSTFARDWLSSKYHQKIMKAAKELCADLKDVRYEVHSSLRDENDVRTIDLKSLLKNSIKAVRKIANKPEVKVMEGVSSRLLNPKYTFENFVIGKDTRLAHAVCQAVAKDPGGQYNPLFIYGGVGLGKTHLLQATGNQILSDYPDKVVVYMTSERFINEIVAAIGKRNTKQFKDRYRKVDCLIVDDIQFMANKESTQEEFFHTFNDLYESNKQIIISSDRPPRELKGIEDRLRSRFQMGMIVDLIVPDYETRLAILHAKCQEHQVLVAPDVLEFIAYNIHSSIRELEGVLLQAIARSQVEHTTPTIRMVAEMLKKLNQTKSLEGMLGDFDVLMDEGGLSGGGALTMERVMESVADYFHLTKSDLTGNVRRKEVMVPRQICMYLIRNELEKSFERIGEQFGGRNHTTVMHACNKIVTCLRDDSKLVKDVNSIKQTLGL